MANRRYTQFMYSLHKMPVKIDVDINIGATGAVTSFAGLGVAAVARMNTGVYRIQLEDNYTNFYGLGWDAHSNGSGAGVAGGAFVVGTTYRILTLGNTTLAQWVAAGLPAGITPAIGVVFTATAVGAGTGTVQPLIMSAVFAVEVMGDPVLTLAPQNFAAVNYGGFITIATYNASAALVNPANGTRLDIELYLSNSSSAINGIV